MNIGTEAQNSLAERGQLGLGKRPGDRFAKASLAQFGRRSSPAQQQLAEARRPLRLMNQRLITSQNQLRALTYLKHVNARPQRQNSSFLHRSVFQYATHLHIIGEDKSSITHALLQY